MATTSFSHAFNNSTDAAFRTWVGNIITALETVGLVRTTDTGQVNASTVLAPTTSAAVQGYAIFRFNDSLQATKPLFLKLEFGSGGVAGTPNMYLTVGKGSDGAGELTGILLPRTRMGNGTANSSAFTTAAAQGYASGGEGWVALVPFTGLNLGLYQGHIYFVIERSRDRDGDGVFSITSDGITAAVGSYISSTNASMAATNVSLNSPAFVFPQFVTINYETAVSNSGACPVVVPFRVGGTVMGTSTALASGGIGPVFPWTAIAPNLAPWQCVCSLSYPGGDAPSGVFTTRLLGAVRTYLAIGISDSVHGFGVGLATLGDSVQGGHKLVGLAIRWE